MHSCEIFYSYAPEDKALCDELDKHLTTLKHLGLISVWNNQDILAGTEWMHEVNYHLNTADIILILISANFLSSDYYTSVEMNTALERHTKGEAHIIPILLRPVEWEGLPLTQLRVLPPGGMPITSWQDQNQAFAAIAKELRKVILSRDISSTDEERAKQSSFAPIADHTIIEAEVSAKLSSFQSTLDTSPPTIDTHGAIALFHQLMQPKSSLRILSLSGDGKMGKTHLLTKVFPILTKNYQAFYANIDLHPIKRIPDILYQACSSLGTSKSSGFNKAYHSWMSAMHSSESRKFSWLHALRSLLSHSHSQLTSSSYERDIYFTKLFIDELHYLTDTPVVLFFDSLEEASDSIQDWLIHVLLVQLLPLPHIQVVIAGRSLPKPDDIYAFHNQHYSLRPIIDIAEYTAYCQKREIGLDEVTIQNFAYGFDYVPGLFTDFVYPKFVRSKITYG